MTRSRYRRPVVLSVLSGFVGFGHLWPDPTSLARLISHDRARHEELTWRPDARSTS